MRGLLRRVAILVLAGGGALGCGLNTFATPDTLPVGKTQIVGGAEGWVRSTHYRTDDSDFPERERVDRGLILWAPRFIARHGLTEWLEGGAGLGAASMPHVELKAQVLRGRFGLAFQPTWRALFLFPVPPTPFIVDLPLLVGVRPLEGLDLVFSPGATFVRRRDNRYFGDVFLPKDYARFGAGVRMRLGRKLSLHPEVTYLRSFDSPASTWITAGIAVTVNLWKQQ